MAGLVALCAPFMIALRFVSVGSPLFYAGMAAGSFLPLALYGPALAVIQRHVAPRMRSTISGFTMMLINVFAIALGNFTVGLLSDRLASAGAHAPLTFTLLGTDVIACCALPCFLLLARCMRTESTGASGAASQACRNMSA